MISQGKPFVHLSNEWVVFCMFWALMLSLIIFLECSYFGAKGFFGKYRPFFKQAVPWQWSSLSIQGKQKPGMESGQWVSV